MALFDFLKAGRKRKVPERETRPFPTIQQIYQRSQTTRYLYKATPRNLRYFSHTPYARRAINAIKCPIAMLDWEIVPIPGVELNSELERQIEVAKTCFQHPNQDDSFETLLEQIVEDFLVGAAAVEIQVSGDKNRPLWMFPVDGLSIQMYPMWSGVKDDPRYAQVVGYGTAYGGGTVAELRNDELIYIRPNPSTATPFGFGPLEIAFNTINNILGVAEFAGNLASNAVPPFGIDLGDGVSIPDLQAFRGYWTNEVEGQGVIPITAMAGKGGDKARNGIQVLKFYPEGDKALYLEYQNFLIRTLAASFDLSPQNFGIERDVNRNTSEVSEDRDYAHAIKPCAHKIASHLTREALHGRLGFSQIMFRFNGLEREDEEATAKIYEIYYKNNAITPNEQRAKLGKPPEENQWGDLNFADVQIAMDAARSAAQVLDDDLTGGAKAPAKKPSKGK